MLSKGLFALAKIAEMPQIVSATKDSAWIAAEELFKNIFPDTVRMEPPEAEYAKLVVQWPIWVYQISTTTQSSIWVS